jgi:hypothetical protein
MIEQRQYGLEQLAEQPEQLIAYEQLVNTSKQQLDDLSARPEHPIGQSNQLLAKRPNQVNLIANQPEQQLILGPEQLADKPSQLLSRQLAAQAIQTGSQGEGAESVPAVPGMTQAWTPASRQENQPSSLTTGSASLNPMLDRPQTFTALTAPSVLQEDLSPPVPSDVEVSAEMPQLQALAAAQPGQESPAVMTSAVQSSQVAAAGSPGVGQPSRTGQQEEVAFIVDRTPGQIVISLLSGVLLTGK